MKSFSDKSDIWSLGCILFKLCTGEEAFPDDADTIWLDFTKEKRDVTVHGIDEPQNGQLCDIIAKTLDTEAPNRPSATSLRRALAEIVTSPAIEIRYEKTSNFDAHLTHQVNFAIAGITQTTIVERDTLIKYLNSIPSLLDKAFSYRWTMNDRSRICLLISNAMRLSRLLFRSTERFDKYSFLLYGTRL